MSYSLEAWVREAARYQKLSEARRSRARRRRRLAALEWLTIILLSSGIIVALALDVRL